MRATLQLTLFVLAAALHQGSALKCWVCSSNTNPECDDPIKESEHSRRFFIKDCDELLGQHSYTYEKQVCRKQVQIAHGNKRIVIRSCTIPLPDEQDTTDGVCADAPTASGITTESCHICTTDLCNGAHSAMGPASTLTSLCFGISSVLLAFRWRY